MGASDQQPLHSKDDSAESSPKKKKSCTGFSVCKGLVVIYGILFFVSTVLCFFCAVHKMRNVGRLGFEDGELPRSGRISAYLGSSSCSRLLLFLGPHLWCLLPRHRIPVQFGQTVWFGRLHSMSTSSIVGGRLKLKGNGRVLGCPTTTSTSRPYRSTIYQASASVCLCVRHAPPPSEAPCLYHDAWPLYCSIQFLVTMVTVMPIYER